jgi:hypothetical protein
MRSPIRDCVSCPLGSIILLFTSLTFFEEPETRSVLGERNDGSESTSEQSYANCAHALWS